LLQAEDRHCGAGIPFADSLSELIWRIHDVVWQCDTRKAAQSAMAAADQARIFRPEGGKAKTGPAGRIVARIGGFRLVSPATYED
jgi:G:T-mismatch repair DNA endonuclease (very short patch repair protein)